MRARYTADPTCESTQAVTITAALGSPGAITTTLTQPTCLLPTGTILITSPTGAGIEYSINGTTWQTTTTFSGVAAGGYTVRARYTADPTCESTQAETITAALGSPGAITTTLTQPTCAVPTGTVAVTSPLGAGIEYSINGTVWQTTTTFSGVTAGGYTVRARYTADPTCESTQAVTITAALGSPGAIATTLTQPTCAVPTGTVEVTSPLGAGIEYSINGTTWQTTTTFSGVTAGGYTVRARYTADPTCESTQAVTITAALGSPGAIATTLTQPTCLVPTGTILITSPTGAGIEYSINGTVWQTTTTFSGVAAGGYTVRARYTADPTCESTQAVTITAALGSPGAIATTLTQPTCLVPTGTILITSPTGAGIEYSINGTTWQTTTTFSGVAAGGYTVRARYTADPTCESTQAVTITAALGSPGAIATTLTQPTCLVPTGTILITSPTGAGIEYSINGTTWQTTTTFSGVASGGYTLRARYTADPTCESTQAVTITAALGSPGAITTTLTQPTCLLPTGTILITSPTGAGIEYSINGTAWQTTTTFSGVAAGGYTVRARYTADPTCESTLA